MEIKYYEKRGITYKAAYKFVGYGMDANPIYAEHITIFSIAKGVIQLDVFNRFCTEDGMTYTSSIR